MTKIYKLIFAALLCTNTLFAGVQNLILKELTAAELPANTLFKFPNAVKTKYVQLDLALLDEQNVFSINLFEGNQIDFRYDRMYSYTNGAYSWVGKSISGSGDIIISTFQSNISGIFRDNAGTKYMLQQINQSDIYAITEVNIEAMNEAPDGVKDYVVSSGIDKKTRVNADVCAAGNACAGSVTIDLMVLGAAAAITNAGSVPAFIADVTSAVTEMNTAYTNSGGTNLTFNLAHCNSTAFATTADMSNDLTNFAADAGVQALRNTYYADLVGLWAGSGNYAGFCGLGYLNINATNYSNTAAFTVTDYGCGMTNLSFAHECGHIWDYVMTGL